MKSKIRVAIENKEFMYKDEYLKVEDDYVTMGAFQAILSNHNLTFGAFTKVINFLNLPVVMVRNKIDYKYFNVVHRKYYNIIKDFINYHKENTVKYIEEEDDKINPQCFVTFKRITNGLIAIYNDGTSEIFNEVNEKIINEIYNARK